MDGLQTTQTATASARRDGWNRDRALHTHRGSLEISRFSPVEVVSLWDSRVVTSVTGALFSVLLHLALIGAVSWGGGRHDVPTPSPRGTRAIQADVTDEMALQWVSMDEGDSAQSGIRAARALLAVPRLIPITPIVDLVPVAANLPETDSGSTHVGDNGGAGAPADGRYLGQISARIDRAWRRPAEPIGANWFICQARIDQERPPRRDFSQEHDVMKPRLRTSRAALAACVCWAGCALADDQSIDVGFKVTADARPFSADWLHESKFADDAVGRLAAELSTSGPPQGDSWSQRSAAELRSAIASDDLLRNNAWNGVRCSRSGCIAAIESLDAGIAAPPPATYERMTLFKGRLLAFLTPRPATPIHSDFTVLQTDSAAVGQRNVLVFFLFPPSAAVISTSGAARVPESSQAVSPAISESLKLATRALQAKQWSDALRYLKAARAMAGLTAHDEKAIAESEGFAYAHLLDYRLAQAAYERALPFALALSSHDIPRDQDLIVQMAILNKHYLTAIEVGRSLLQHDGSRAKVMAEIGFSYFGIKDCKYAVSWADKSAALSAKSGMAQEGLVETVKPACERLYDLVKNSGLTDQTIVTH
jgi:tetratricopeptide (TPR) repeat protein